MGCSQSSVANLPPASIARSPSTLSVVLADPSAQNADSLSTTRTRWRVPKLVNPARRRRSARRAVSVATATTVTTGNALTLRNRVSKALLSIRRRHVHPGAILVQEASVGAQVDQTQLESPTTLQQSGCVRPQTRMALPPTPAARQVTLEDSRPDSVSPVSQSPALEDGPLQLVQQQSHSPPPARTPAIPSSASRCHTHIVQTYFTVPAREELLSPLKALQRHLKPAPNSCPQRLLKAQQCPRRYPITFISRYDVSHLQSPPVPDLRNKHRTDKIPLHIRRPEAHLRRSPRRPQQAQKVPWPIPPLPSWMSEREQGLRESLHPEERNSRREAHTREPDSSLPSSFSFASLERRPATPPPGMEMPEESHILPYERTRGGIAYEYLFDLSRAQISTPGPLTQSSRRHRWRRIQQELAPRMRMFAEKRRQQLDEWEAWEQICRQADKFMSQDWVKTLLAEREERLKKEKKEARKKEARNKRAH